MLSEWQKISIALQLLTTHRIFHTGLCTLNTGLCTLHTELFTLHVILCTLHTIQCTLNTPYYTLHSAHYKLHTIHNTLHTIFWHFTNAQYSVFYIDLTFIHQMAEIFIGSFLYTFNTGST